jgi:hypothetical protein
MEKPKRSSQPPMNESKEDLYPYHLNLHVLHGMKMDDQGIADPVGTQALIALVSLMAQGVLKTTRLP